MNIVDAVLLLALLAGAVIGFKKGFIKTMVSLIGTILVIVLSFKLSTYHFLILKEHMKA